MLALSLTVPALGGPLGLRAGGSPKLKSIAKAANRVLKAAVKAEELAIAAQSTASSAQEMASSAGAMASGARGTVASAKTTASSAQSTASGAGAMASAAQSTASSAGAAASDAKTKTQAAEPTANGAATQAQEARAVVENKFGGFVSVLEEGVDTPEEFPLEVHKIVLEMFCPRLGVIVSGGFSIFEAASEPHTSFPRFGSRWVAVAEGTDTFAMDGWAYCLTT